MEHIRGLRYKIHIMGTPIAGPTYMYGENMSVIYNTYRPESTLKKKSNSIYYHTMREAFSMGKVLKTHIRSENHPSYMFTDVMPSDVNQDNFTQQGLYNTP